MTLAWFWPNGRSTGTSRPSPSRSCSTNSPGGNCPPGGVAPRGEHAHELVGVDEAALGEPHAPSARTPTAARSARPPAPPAARRWGARGLREEDRHLARRAPSTGTRPWIVTPSRPRPSVAGAYRATKACRSSSETSRTGQTCRMTRLPWSRWPGGRRAWARRMAPRVSRSIRSSSGSCITWPAASRTGVRSRTSATTNRRSSRGLPLRDRPEDVDVLDRREPLEVEVLEAVQLQALRHHRVGVAEEAPPPRSPRRGPGGT